MSMKNSNDTIGNRTLDLPACSAMPQPAATPRVPTLISKRGRDISCSIATGFLFKAADSFAPVTAGETVLRNFSLLYYGK